MLRDQLTRSLNFFITIGVVTMLYIIASERAEAQPACSSSDDLSCEVYSDCIERNCKCETTNSKYVTQFGLKYCRKFGSQMTFSSAGRAWRDKTLKCLKDGISAAYVRNDGPPCDCAKIQAEAVASHTACYTSAPSFCSLNDADIRVVARIVDIEDVVRLGTNGVGESARTLYVCFKQVGLSRGFQLISVFGAETITEFGESGRDHLLRVIENGRRYAVDELRSDIAVKFDELREVFRRRLP